MKDTIEAGTSRDDLREVSDKRLRELLIKEIVQVNVHVKRLKSLKAEKVRREKVEKPGVC